MEVKENITIPQSIWGNIKYQSKKKFNYYIKSNWAICVSFNIFSSQRMAEYFEEARTPQSLKQSPIILAKNHYYRKF